MDELLFFSKIAGRIMPGKYIDREERIACLNTLATDILYLPTRKYKTEINNFFVWFTVLFLFLGNIFQT